MTLTSIKILLNYLLLLFLLGQLFQAGFLKAYHDLHINIQYRHRHLHGFVDHLFPGLFIFDHIKILEGNPFLFQPFLGFPAPGAGGRTIDFDIHTFSICCSFIYFMDSFIYDFSFVVYYASSTGFDMVKCLPQPDCPAVAVNLIWRQAPLAGKSLGPVQYRRAALPGAVGQHYLYDSGLEPLLSGSTTTIGLFIPEPYLEVPDRFRSSPQIYLESESIF